MDVPPFPAPDQAADAPLRIVPPSRTLFAACRRCIRDPRLRHGLRLLRNEAPLASASAVEVLQWLGDGLSLTGTEATLASLALGEGLRSYQESRAFDLQCRLRAFLRRLLEVVWRTLRGLQLQAAAGEVWQLDAGVPLADWIWDHLQEGEIRCTRLAPAVMTLERFAEMVVPQDAQCLMIVGATGSRDWDQSVIARTRRMVVKPNWIPWPER